MQAKQRGKQARKQYAQMGAADASEQIAAEEAQRQEEAEEAAAADYLSDPNAAASATKMQAIQRGKNARKERREQDAAATKMQARQRGKNACKG